MGTMTKYFILAIMLFVSACSRAVVREGPPSTQAHLDESASTIVTADSARLPLAVWHPEGKPRAIIVAVHGFNDYSHAFDGPGKFLAERGIALYAYDQRGFGRAPNVGVWPGTDTLIDDLDTAVALIAQKNPDVPLFVLGESMGGAVAMLAKADTVHPMPKVDGIILAAPAVWGRRSMGLAPRVALWVSRNFMPWLRVSGSGLQIWPSDNIPMLRALSRDPLVIKETRADAIDGLVNLMSDAQVAAPKVTGPVLMLYGQHDQLVPPGPVYRVIDELPSQPVAPVTKIYPKGYHMLLRDLDAPQVLNDIASWVDSRTKSLATLQRHATG